MAKKKKKKKDANDLETLAMRWITAKEHERAAIETRRDIENQIGAQLSIDDGFEGTRTTRAGGYKVKLVSRVTRSVDGDRLQEIAREHGLSDHLSQLFKWKPSVIAAAWKSASDEITKPLEAAITDRLSRPSYTVELIEGE